MRYIAIDFGNKRTGLAICDKSETIASPLTVVKGRENLAERIAEIAKSERAEALVLGLPLNMDGSEGQQAKLAREFGAQIAGIIDIPVYFQDERLSSFGAGEKLSQMGLSHGKRAERLDAIAAAEILTAFLEEKSWRQSCNQADSDQ